VLRERQLDLFNPVGERFNAIAAASSKTLTMVRC
jgi:hypothetical protein